MRPPTAIRMATARRAIVICFRPVEPFALRRAAGRRPGPVARPPRGQVGYRHGGQLRGSVRRVDLLGVDEVPDGTMQMAWVDGTDQVLVVNVGGTIRAMQ